MNLPCMFTSVGLMQDENRPKDIFLIDTDKAYKDRDKLIKETGLFLESLSNKNYNPRGWVLKNAIATMSHKKWEQTMIEFQKLSGWSLLSSQTED